METKMAANHGIDDYRLPRVYFDNTPFAVTHYSSSQKPFELNWGVQPIKPNGTCDKDRTQI